MDQFVHPSKSSYSNTGSDVDSNEPGYGRISSNSNLSDCQAIGRSQSNGLIHRANGLGQYDISVLSSKSLPTSNSSSPVRGAGVHDKNRLVDPKQRAPGAIERIAIEGSAPPKFHQQSDYKMYERGNIIAASKYATPKQVENITVGLSNTIISDKVLQGTQTRQAYIQGYTGNQNGAAHSVIDHNKYYSTTFITKPGASSPTHSHSGSSRESNSPRTSIAGVQNYDYSKNSPLYENIDYYSSRAVPQAPYYHQLPQTHSNTQSNHISQDSKHSSPRTSYISVENNTCSNFKYETNHKKAQPQVPVGNKYINSNSFMSKEIPPYEAPPVYENIQDLNKMQNCESSRPGPQVPASVDPKKSMISQSTVPPPYPGHNHSDTNISQTSQQYSTTIQKQPAPMVKVSVGVHEQRAHATLPNPVPAKSIFMSAAGAGQTSVAMSNQCSIMSGIAGCANPVQLSAQDSPPSPTLSAKLKAAPGSAKNLLPYNVTPPRSQVSQKRIVTQFTT